MNNYLIAADVPLKLDLGAVSKKTVPWDDLKFPERVR